MATFELLREWAMRYVKHRDIFARKISEIKPENYGLEIRNSDGTASVCVVQLKLSSIEESKIAAASIIVALNTPDNIKAAEKLWKKLALNPKLVLVFANPDAVPEDKWLVKPFIHDRVCDSSNLLNGLKAMAELVPFAS